MHVCNGMGIALVLVVVLIMNMVCIIMVQFHILVHVRNWRKDQKNIELNQPW
jgi:hypothetical protein